jgi:hypothetical protein
MGEVAVFEHADYILLQRRYLSPNTTMIERVFRLKGACNNYPWGKKGSESLASQLQRKNDTGFQLTEDEFYSELWFGDYPDFPARVLETGELLKDVIDRNKEDLLGKAALEKFDGNLPFLPKVIEHLDLLIKLRLLTFVFPDTFHFEGASPANPPQQEARGPTSRAGPRKVQGPQPQTRNCCCAVPV